MRNFIQWWLGIFVVTSVMLSLVGFVPKKMGELQNKIYTALMYSNVIAGEKSTSQPEVLTSPTEEIERPTRLVISSVGIDFDIVEPESTENKVLDEALTKGIVHYPGSGFLGERRNMLFFGHSSNLRYVRNSAYKALTGIEKLKVGDEIKVGGEFHEYYYKVESVRLADKNEELVEFKTGEQELTISTCNTFGKKDDRYVVKASFVNKIDIQASSR